mgnify:CR=1 FL=1
MLRGLPHNLKYLEDKKYWEKWFPADFITEMHEQVRLWFYATLFVSTVLEDKTPYKSVLAHGMVLDEKMPEVFLALDIDF